MSVIIAVPHGSKLGEGFSKRARFEGDALHPGRRTDGRQSAATWITTLTDTGKVILLCSWCRPKFNPRRHGYRRFFSPDTSGRTDGFVSNGMCDACKSQTALSPGGGTSFIREDYYQQVCQDPATARRNARRAWAGPSAWDRVSTYFMGSRGPTDAAAKG
jgi:hypothetical protein